MVNKSILNVTNGNNHISSHDFASAAALPIVEIDEMVRVIDLSENQNKTLLNDDDDKLLKKSKLTKQELLIQNKLKAQRVNKQNSNYKRNQSCCLIIMILFILAIALAIIGYFIGMYDFIDSFIQLNSFFFLFLFCFKKFGMWSKESSFGTNWSILLLNLILFFYCDFNFIYFFTFFLKNFKIFFF